MPKKKTKTQKVGGNDRNEEKVVSDEFLPKKDLLRVQTAALYFDVHEKTIKRWGEHGLLDIEKKEDGTLWVTRRSIIRFRNGNQP